MASLHQAIHRKPLLVVGAFLAVMMTSVLGLVAWKASVARQATLVRAQEDLGNLARSLARHATTTLKAPDVAMTGLADLLKYQSPLPERFNAHLVATTRSLPQIREIGVLDAEGNWRYSSFVTRLPDHNNSDRTYFVHHRDNPSPKMLLSGPIISRTSGQQSIILSKRISTPTGEFAGVVVAAIDCDYFSNFYSSFGVGAQGGISLLSTDGTMFARSPVVESGRKIADTSLFQKRTNESPSGSYKITSPFDGLTKYIAYELDAEYAVVVTVARSEDEVLANWRTDLISDRHRSGPAGRNHRRHGDAVEEPIQLQDRIGTVAAGAGGASAFVGGQHRRHRHRDGPKGIPPLRVAFGGGCARDDRE
ncbi:hypothetical protein ACVWXL_008251 [Bradyrhizobium sp. GM22.5]